MTKTFLLVILTFVLSLVACSKSDNNTPIVPEIDENFIGLKAYGEEINSYDESMNLFETSNGYISFENINKYDLNIANTYEGIANVVIRKLNDKFESTNEFTLETNTYDILSSVSKIDESTYIIAGRFSVEKEIFSRPFVKIVNVNGEVLESLVLGGSETVPYNTDRPTKLFYKNGVIYVADRIMDNFLSLVALDVNLNELWRRDFPVAGSGAIYVDDTIYFGMIDYPNGNNQPPTISLQILDVTDGSTIDSFDLDNSVSRRVSIDKIKEYNGNLYLIGGTDSSSPNFGGYILKLNKADGQKLDELFVPKMYSLYDIAISESDILIVGNSKSNEQVIKIDNEGDVLWTYQVPNNPLGGKLYKLIDNQDGIIFSGGLNLQASDRSTDSTFGLLDNSGKLK